MNGWVNGDKDWKSMDSWISTNILIFYCWSNAPTLFWNLQKMSFAWKERYCLWSTVMLFLFKSDTPPPTSPIERASLSVRRRRIEKLCRYVEPCEPSLVPSIANWWLTMTDNEEIRPKHLTIMTLKRNYISC